MARKRRAISITLATGCFWLGRLMKKIAFAAIAALGFAGAASAADMPVKAPVAPAPPIQLPYNWGGLYLGGHVGYLWGRTRVEEDGLVTEPNASTSGVIGGVMAGYNWQTGPWVFGVEGDFGWTNAHGTGVADPTDCDTQYLRCELDGPRTWSFWYTHSTTGFFSLLAVLPSPISNFMKAKASSSPGRKI